MVKKLDKNIQKPPDHIGWDLWRANRAWQRDFVAEMRAVGHDWMTEARASLLGCIAPAGTRQTVLIERMGISKQAVQQLVDGLEEEGIVGRRTDPKDRRARIVAYTPRGLVALRAADGIKRDIEARYRALLGKDVHAVLKDALARISAACD